MRSSWSVVTVLIVVCVLPSAAQERVRSWEEEVVIPTYQPYPDDVNPKFLELEGSVIYPYTMQDNLSAKRSNQTYRGVFLENEYLKVMALPEIGGRIQTVYDKIRGEQMFHDNGVVKPGLIALRGAWISGGIEWNRGPTGHTVTSFSPVDVVTVENPDGSASLVIGYTEMNFRTTWQVRLTLHPGRAVLDEQISISNPTDGFHSYYFWNNTALPNTPGTRFIYPMTLGSDHNGTSFFSWPMDNDRDLSWLKNYPEPTSVFAYECVFDFFGAYDVDRDYGIVQVANHHELPGKKAWTWGQSGDGLASQRVLTETAGPYIEVQSGPLRTQADYGMLGPGQNVSWQEWWYPVSGLGDGFEYATENVAIQRAETDTGLEFRVMATQKFSEAQLSIVQNGRVVATDIVDLSPVLVQRIRFDGNADVPVEVSVRTQLGDTLATYTSPLPIPNVEEPVSLGGTPEDKLSVEQKYRNGYDADVSLDRIGAREWYGRALEDDINHSPSLVALAALDTEAGLYEVAAARLERALKRDATNGMAAYLLGVTRLQLGDLEEALRLGYVATRQPEMAELGFGLIGRAQMRAGHREAALLSFSRGFDRGGRDRIRLLEQMLIAAYDTERWPQATGIALSPIRTGTTRLVPRAILALLGEVSAADFAAEARAYVGEKEFTFLELSLTFADLGLYREAADLLSVTMVEGVPTSEHRPLPFYYLAYYESRVGNRTIARKYLDRAAGLKRDYVFPSRPETIDVLEYAVRETPDDARAREYLGNLLAGLGRLDEAAQSWREAADRDLSLSVARRNLGLYSWRVAGDLDAAVEWYTAAIVARPSDQTLHRDLAQLHIARHFPTTAIDLLEKMPSTPRRRADATVLLARTYLNVSRYDDAIELLDRTTFSNREGDSDTWTIFSNAHIERGILRLDSNDAFGALEDFERALTYPTNLNAGRPSQPHEARAQYWKGRALEAMGQDGAARAAWQAGMENPPTDEDQIEYIRLSWQALAIQKSPGTR